MIEFISVSKCFKQKTAVNNASFVIPSGSVTALIGANGSGKTTIMRMISTIIKPTHGKITVDGFDPVKSTDAVRSRIGLMLGGDSSLYDRFTARENIEYFGRLRGMSLRDSIVSTARLADALDMNKYIDKPVGTFSRGMRQKVMLADALVHDPSVILLDEPSTGLDIYAAIEIQNMIRSCVNKSRTILLSSHNMNEIEALCDHAIIIDDGKILFSGDMDTLFSSNNASTVQEAFIRLTSKQRKE